MYAQILQVVALEIEKQVNKPIEKYTLVYRYGNDTVQFVLNDDPQKVPLNDATFANGLKMWLDSNAEIPDGFSLMYAILLWNGPNERVKIGIHFKHNETGALIDETKYID